ncbi:MAG: hypothetical protein IJY11_03270 [Clostridia bacterium]|nr:hypothetical protein [Clostridia bacterium]
MKGKKKLLMTVTAFAMSAVAFSGTFGVAQASAADGLVHSCEEDQYCLVCDLAQKINEELPIASEISLDNAAAVIQTIHDIDRIKFDLTDEQFDELSLLVDVGAYGYVYKYYQAIDAVNNVEGGINLAIAKSIVLSGETLSSTEETEISFEIVNVDTNQATTLTMYDLGTSMNTLTGDEPLFQQTCFTTGNGHYEMTADGWIFQYVLSAGTYTIREINLEKPVTINGKQRCNPNVTIQTEEGAVYGDTVTVTLTEGETSNVSFTNSYSSISIYKFVDEEGNLLTEGVTVTGTDFDGETEIVGSQTYERDYSYSGTLTLTEVPEGYCLPNPIDYEISNGSENSFGDNGQLHISQLAGETTFTWTLYEHSYGEWTETKAPTGTEEGLRQRECISCGHIEEESIPVKEEEGSYLILLIIAGVFLVAVMMFIATKKG